MPRLVKDPQNYFSGLAPHASSALDAVASLAARSGVPMIGPAMGQLLGILATAMRARRVLELGTAVGYSTVFLAQAMLRTKGRVLGVDINPAHCRTARQTLQDCGLDFCSDVLCADARTLPLREGCFDFIFLDVDQRYYTELEPVCHRLLRSGGLLAADNTSFVDARGFNLLMADLRRWHAVNLLGFWPGHAPEQDGLCLALKNAHTHETENI